MTESTQPLEPGHSPPPIPTATLVPFPVDSSPMTEKEVGEGKAFAIISYVLNFLRLPFWLVPLIMRDNDFALYHAKQCMLLWIAAMVATVAAVPLVFLCGIGIPIIIGIAIAAIVLNVIGLINASNGRAKPLPLIGGYAERWFRGIHKVSL